jgi:hypothetical protein
VTGTFLVMMCLVGCSVQNHEDGYILDALDQSEPASGQVHSIISDISYHDFDSYFVLRD